ncbi:DoxX-like family protein [Eionea flava]
MNSRALNHIALVSRLLLGFLFVYHGLVPKVLWLSAVEIELLTASGLALRAEVFSPLAGIAEIILGCFIIVLNRSIFPVYIAAFSLMLLLAYVAFASPQLLVEAFNPVTTNIMGLGFCYIILLIYRQQKV